MSESNDLPADAIHIGSRLELFVDGWPGKVKLSDRTPLAYAVSRDDGKTWGAPVVIEDDPETGFSYVAIHFTEDTVLLAYFIEIFVDRGFKRVLRMREIPVADLTA